MSTRKYCVATCHNGTDMGIFRSGPDDERLTLEEAKKLDGKGKFLFDCTAEQYWKMEREALQPDPGRYVLHQTTTRYSGNHPDDRFKAATFYHECEMCKGEHIAGWGIWDNAEQDWIVPDGFESEEEATAIATPFNQWAADKGL